MKDFLRKKGVFLIVVKLGRNNIKIFALRGKFF